MVLFVLEMPPTIVVSLEKAVERGVLETQSVFLKKAEKKKKKAGVCVPLVYRLYF